MVKSALVFVSIVLCISGVSKPAMAQASQQAGKALKDAESAQQKSWEQVDRINREADNTSARLNQSKQSAVKPAQGPATIVKKTQVGVRSPYQKAKPHKKAVPKNK